MDVLACGTGTCALSSSVWVWVWVRVHAWQRMSHSTETTVAAAWLRAGHVCLSTCVDKGARRHTGHSGTRMDGVPVLACPHVGSRPLAPACPPKNGAGRAAGRAGRAGRARKGDLGLSGCTMHVEKVSQRCAKGHNCRCNGASVDRGGRGDVAPMDRHSNELPLHFDH